MGKRLSKQSIQTIALHRITKLFNLAEEQAKHQNYVLANRYVYLARKIAMKSTISIPKMYKQNYCRYCYHYLLPGKTCQIRFHKGRKIITCFHCKKHIRYPLHKP